MLSMYITSPVPEPAKLYWKTYCPKVVPAGIPNVLKSNVNSTHWFATGMFTSIALFPPPVDGCSN